MQSRQVRQQLFFSFARARPLIHCSSMCTCASIQLSKFTSSNFQALVLRIEKASDTGCFRICFVEQFLVLGNLRCKLPNRFLELRSASLRGFLCSHFRLSHFQLPSQSFFSFFLQLQMSSIRHFDDASYGSQLFQERRDASLRISLRVR